MKGQQVNDLTAISHTFNLGAASMAWLNGPISLALFHGNITRLGKDRGVLDEEQVIRCDFLPDIDDSGRCNISLYTTRNPETLTVDCRLPFNKVPSSTYSNLQPEKVLGDIMENTRTQIFRDIDECFPCGDDGSGYLALIQKSVIAHLDVRVDSQESVGSGIHLLLGKSEMKCYKRGGSNSWTVQNTELQEDSPMSKIKVLNSYNSDPMSNEEILRRIRDFSLSIKDVTGITDLNNDQFQSQAKRALSSYSLFVLKTFSGIVHPILFKDPTEEENLLYSTSHGPQPLFNLEDYEGKKHKELE